MNNEDIGDTEIINVLVNQSGIAKLFDVDRTTIHAWQKKGLPVIHQQTKGKENLYCIPVCLRWRWGREIAADRRWRVKLTGTLMTVCFGFALDYDDADHDLEKIYQLITASIDTTVEEFYQTFGYCLAIVHQKKGLVI